MKQTYLLDEESEAEKVNESSRIYDKWHPRINEIYLKKLIDGQKFLLSHILSQLFQKQRI